MRHAIRFENDSLYFSASHFITFGEPEKVEALHGHNFVIKAEIAGPLNSKAYVVDFIAAYDILKRVCETLSHKVLLARNHPYIKIKQDGDLIRVSVPPLSWSFPVDDTFLLPVKNTTTEALAEYIAETFRSNLENDSAFEFQSKDYAITIELEESPGMWAVYRH